MISTDFSYPYLISSARDKEFGVEKKKGKTKTAPFPCSSKTSCWIALEISTVCS